MKAILKWLKVNPVEDEVRVYRDTQPFDENNLPAILATLTAGTTEYEDATVVDKTRYHYRVATVIRGVEHLGAERIVAVDSDLEVPYGIWVSAVADASGSTAEVERPFYARYDRMATTNFQWDRLFGLTDGFAVSQYSATGNPDTGTFGGTINRFSPFYTFWIEAQCRSDYNGFANFDLEFKDATDTVVAALRCRRDVSYGVSLWYGPDLANLTRAPRTSTTYTEVAGHLRFDAGGFTYTMDPALPLRSDQQVTSFRYDVDLTTVTKVAVSNARAQHNASNSVVFVLLQLVDQRLFDGFTVSADSGAGESTLTWQEAAPDSVDEVRIYRDTGLLDPQNLPTPLATVSGGVETYVDTVPSTNDDYFYLIDVVAAGTSHLSGQSVAVYSDLSNGLVAWYTMDNISGSVLVDDSGNGYDGVMAGVSQAPSFLSGGGQALEFVPSSVSHVDITPAVPTGTTYTVAVWLKPDIVGGSNDWWVASNRSGSDPTPSGSWQLIYYPQTANDIMFQIFSGGSVGSRLRSYYAPQVGVAVHAVVTYDGTIARFYINGAETGQLAISVPGSTATHTRIGAMGWVDPVNSNSGLFDGLMDDLRFYNRALTATEVQALYNLNA
ncbi:LamG domain-containing protein [Halomonas sp. SSL-5]|uniref:LamG domain-containing protein n=1 Tax=Halomonas sp. SSL-5 TaxID=3065855 RepID=UPI00273853CA|nr:LamG domain-containing protein [Halomonas sp. SSL-5]MDY7117118.1 LamG domain-containing protein [Halomonas sp. SSL-5]